MIRSFVALELPEEVRDEIRRAQESFRAAEADVKWVRPAGVHLTLKFLGGVPEELISDTAEAAARIAARRPAFDLALTAPGVFPNRKKARVIWLGLDGDLENLAGFQKEIEDALVPLGFEAEDRAFKPHLTLGRVRSGRNKSLLLSEIDRFQTRPIRFTVREAVLFKSDLKPTGAQYTPLRRMSLAASPA